MFGIGSWVGRWAGAGAVLLAVAVGSAAGDSASVVGRLKSWLQAPRAGRPALEAQEFARTPLARGDAEVAAGLLWEDRVAWLKESRRAEIEARKVEAAGKTMRFEWVRFGPPEPPAGGRSLFISMHGGGGAPTRVNDSQWTNQVRLGRAYAPKEGIYVAPRAPSDNWNLWHEPHIDELFARLVESLVALEGVNPDRVYLMGYSAGGDGVYQLAPRMADWWAAASMMAGHPNESQPFGLRNVPFVLMVGERDAMYRRNAVAAEWGEKLKALREADAGGYEHLVRLPAGKGHWMDLEDKAAIPWMEARVRNALPSRIAWRQDDVLHDRFYWLGVPKDEAKAGQQVVAVRDGQTVRVENSDARRLRVLLNDSMADLDRPVRVDGPGGRTLHDGVVKRTLATLWKTLEERGDRRLMFSAELVVELP